MTRKGPEMSTVSASPRVRGSVGGGVSSLVAYSIRGDDGEHVFVRGTDAITKAAPAAGEFADSQLQDDRGDEPGRWTFGLVRSGWFRFNPCHESSCFDGGGHAWHIGYVDGPGRGRFKGVLLEPRWRESPADHAPADPMLEQAPEVTG